MEKTAARCADLPPHPRSFLSHVESQKGQSSLTLFPQANGEACISTKLLRGSRGDPCLCPCDLGTQLLFSSDFAQKFDSDSHSQRQLTLQTLLEGQLTCLCGSGPIQRHLQLGSSVPFFFFLSLRCFSLTDVMLSSSLLRTGAPRTLAMSRALPFRNQLYVKATMQCPFS